MDVIEAKPASATPLARLRVLTWTAAAPKDLWRLFSLLTMPLLSDLRVDLGAADLRWLHSSGNNPSTTEIQKLQSHASVQVIRLPALTRLHLDCKDPDALIVAIRKFSFPSLEQLVLSYTNSSSRDELPVLPAIGKIFREPRLAKLTHLELRHFSLDLNEAIATLAYMQSLESLFIYGCPGTSDVRAFLPLHSTPYRHGRSPMCTLGQRVRPPGRRVTC